MSGPKKFEPREEFAEGNFPLGGLRPQQKHPNHDVTLQGRVLLAVTGRKQAAVLHFLRRSEVLSNWGREFVFVCGSFT